MGLKTFQEFREAMKDEAMQRELIAFLNERKPEDTEAKILATAAFAAEKGYAVSAEDLSIESVSRKELSDEEIEKAAGGEWCWSDFSCFAISHYDQCEAVMNSCYSTAQAEYDMKQKCGDLFFEAYLSCGMDSSRKHH